MCKKWLFECFSDSYVIKYLLQLANPFNTLVKKASGRTLFYMVMNAIFGLVPLWSIVYLIFINDKAKAEFSFDGIIKTGVVMFFSTALSGSISLDYNLSDFYHKNRILTYIILATPFYLLVNDCLVYVSIYKSIIPPQLSMALDVVEICTVFLAGIFCVCVKTYLNIFELKNKY